MIKRIYLCVLIALWRLFFCFFVLCVIEYIEKEIDQMYSGVHTTEDVMKEYLIQGCNLDKYGIPELKATNIPTIEETIDFGASTSRRTRNHKKLNVNFYVSDNVFTRFWNNPDKYIKGHLDCFGSVISPDFSIVTGEKGMPFAMNLWNKYRNHALAYYMDLMGITVIPSVSILDKDNWDFGFSALPKHSVLACCTNGRVRSKASRMEFCEGFYEMCDRLDPLRVVLFGYVPDELKSPVEIINMKTRNQKINEEFKEKREESNGDKY